MTLSKGLGSLEEGGVSAWAQGQLSAGRRTAARRNEVTEAPAYCVFRLTCCTRAWGKGSRRGGGRTAAFARHLLVIAEVDRQGSGNSGQGGHLAVTERTLKVTRVSVFILGPVRGRG